MPTQFTEADFVGSGSPAQFTEADFGGLPFSEADFIKPEAAPVRGFIKAGVAGAGNLLKGAATEFEEMPSGGFEGMENMPPAELERYTQRAEARATRTPGQVLTEARSNPLYQAGEALTQAAPYVGPESLSPVAPQISPPLTPAEQASKWTQAGESLAGFLPAAAGPAAPLAMQAQAVGEHVSADFDAAKARGADDETAAQEALDKATMSGAIQGGIFAVMPPVLRGALEKYVVDKFGTTAFARWLLGRAAAGTEGATLGASSTAGENLVEGQPVLQGVGKGAAGLATINLLLPWLRERAVQSPESNVQGPEGQEPSAPPAPPEPGPGPSPDRPRLIENLLAEAGTQLAETPELDVNELLEQMRKNQIEPQPEQPLSISSASNEEPKMDMLEPEQELSDADVGLAPERASEKGILESLPPALTPEATGETKTLAAPETKTGPTAGPETLETPTTSTAAQRGALSEPGAMATGEGLIPVEGGSNPPRSAAAPRTGLGSVTNARGWDLIDEVEGAVGKINPALIKEANPDFKPVGAARKIFSSDGVNAADAAKTLASTGMFKGDTNQPDQLGEALNEAARSRIGNRQGAALEAKRVRQDSAFERDRDRPGPSQVTKVAEDLQVGDTLKVRGAPFKVKSLEFDGDGRVTSVTLDDGEKYGTQIVDGATELQVDNRTYRRGREGVVTDTREDGSGRTRLAQPNEQGRVPAKSDLESWADEVLAGGAVHAGPEVIAAYAVKGAYVVARIARQVALSFEHWSNQMLEEFGAKIGPHLRQIWPEALRLREEQLGEQMGQAIDEPTRKSIERELAEVRAERAKVPQGGTKGAAGETISPKSETEPTPQASPAMEAAAKRQGEIAERLAKINQAEAAGRLSPDLRSERAALARESREIERAQNPDPAYVADLLRQLDKASTDLVNARKAGNGAHASELGLRMDDLMGKLERTPQKLRLRVYRELVERGEIMGTPPPEAAHGMEAEPGERGAERLPATTREQEGLPARRREEIAASKLPGQLGEAWTEVKRFQQKLVALWERSPIKAMMSETKDAADNTAAVFGKRAANTILHALNRAFGADVGERNEMREGALSMVLEAGGGLEKPTDAGGNLMDMREKLQASVFGKGKWGKRALAMIDFAERELEKLEPIARAYARLTDAERASEEAAGYNTLYRDGGYVFHLQDLNANFDFPDVAGSRESGGVAPAPFKHVRDYATYAESIAAGVVPKSLSAVDLLQRRLTLGRRMVNYGAWVEGMRSVVDPRDQLPLATEPDVRIRADGTEDVRAPSGYFLTNFGGRQVAVHSGYSGIFNALTEGSALRQNAFAVGLMKTMAMGKQFTLLGDTFHMGRLAFWNAITRMGMPSYARGQTLLDNTVAEIRGMAERGEIPADWAKNLEQDRARLDLMLRRGLNLGSVGDNLYQDIIHAVPGLGQFNRWLFERYQRGAMAEVAMIEFERTKRMEPQLSDEQVARKVAQGVNTRFGNLQSQGLFKSKTFQDLARTLFLAPQWNESLIRAEIGAVRDVLTAPSQSLRAGRPVMGLLARGVATAVVGQFFANQVINYMTRGKPTWENEEGEDSGAYGWAGAKISAHIPDAAGGPGFFLNPIAIPMEITHLLLKKTERTEGNFMQALREFVSGRLNNLTRPVWTLISKEDMLGRRQRTGADLAKTMLSEALPVPISSGAAYRMGKQILTGQHEEAFPGQFQKQLMQSAGVRTESAPGPEGRMYGLAQRFNSEKGVVPSAEYYAGDYQPVANALRLGNERDAAAAMDDLLQKKTPADVVRHFQSWEGAPFTGNRGREAQFYRSLNAEQQQTYQKARQARAAVATEAMRLVGQRAMALQAAE